MKNVTINSLQNYLKKNDFDANYQKETDQVYFVLKMEQREFPVFVRILSEGALIQVLAFFPVSFNKQTVNDVARLLHLLNKEIDVPGFGLDEDTSVVFFRCMVPLDNNELSEKLFDAYLNTIQLACKSFSPGIEAISAGAISFEEMVKKAKEQMKESS